MAKARTPKARATSRKADVGAERPRGAFLSIRAYAEAIGCDRQTLAAKLAAAAVKPKAEGERGHPEYALRDLNAVYYETATDPDKLDQFRRKAYYTAELDKAKLQTQRGELIAREDVEQEQARIFAVVARTFDTLPDLIERDCGLPAHALARLEEALDAVRVELHRLLTEGEVPAAPAAPAVPAVAA